MENVSAYHSNATLKAVDAVFIILTNITSFTSIVCCLAVIAFYWKWPHLRTTPRKLLLHLCLANFVQCFGSMLQALTYFQSLKFPDERDLICESAASISVMGQVASAMWTCAITVHLFIAITLRAVDLADKLVIIFYIFGWGVPLMVAISAGIADVYGYDITDILYFDHPTVCWISDKVTNKLDWYLITIEGWVIATYFITTLLFNVINFSVICKTTRVNPSPEPEGTTMEDMAAQSATRKMRYIPLIYCFLRMWGTGHLLFTEYPAVRHMRAFDWLLVIRAFGDNAQGLANFLLFCFTTIQIRLRMYRAARMCFSCFGLWCRKQRRRLADDKWLPRPIVRMRVMKTAKRRSVDGSDLDISGISLDLPTQEELDEIIKHTEDEVLFQR